MNGASHARRYPMDKSQADIAFEVLRKIGQQDTSDVSSVIERVAVDFFGGNRATLAECVQLAQVAAKLGAEVGICSPRSVMLGSTVSLETSGAMDMRRRSIHA